MWQLQIIRLNRLKCGIPLSVPQITTAYKVTFSVLTCHVLFIYILQSRLRPIMFALKPNYNNLNKKKAKICRTWYIKTNPLQLRTNQMSYTIVSKILLNSNFPEPLVSTLLCSSSTLQRQAKKKLFNLSKYLQYCRTICAEISASLTTKRPQKHDTVPFSSTVSVRSLASTA